MFNHDKDITEDAVEVIDSVITNMWAFVNIAGIIIFISFSNYCQAQFLPAQ